MIIGRRSVPTNTQEDNKVSVALSEDNPYMKNPEMAQINTGTEIKKNIKSIDVDEFIKDMRSYSYTRGMIDSSGTTYGVGSMSVNEMLDKIEEIFRNHIF